MSVIAASPPLQSVVHRSEKRVKNSRGLGILFGRTLTFLMRALVRVNRAPIGTEARPVYMGHSRVPLERVIQAFRTPDALRSTNA